MRKREWLLVILAVVAQAIVKASVFAGRTLWQKHLENKQEIREMERNGELYG